MLGVSPVAGAVLLPSTGCSWDTPQGKSADTTGTTVISDTTNRSGYERDVCYGASTADLARVRCRGIFFQPPGLLREGPYRRRMVGRAREARNRSRDFSREGLFGSKSVGTDALVAPVLRPLFYNSFLFYYLYPYHSGPIARA